MQTRQLISNNSNKSFDILSTFGPSNISTKTSLSGNGLKTMKSTNYSQSPVSDVITEDINIDDDDDVETALSKLEKSLDVVQLNNTNLKEENIINECIKKDSNNTDSKTNAVNSLNDFSVELCEDLFLIKQQKYTFRKMKSYFFVLNDTYLSYYKSKEESKGRPVDKINLRGCELTPDVNVAARKFGINISVLSAEGMNTVSLKCPNEESYAQWMSACKLASRNKTISDQIFRNEVKSILNLLQMQQKKSPGLISNSNVGTSLSTAEANLNENAEVQATNLLPNRMLKKYKLKQVI